MNRRLRFVLIVASAVMSVSAPLPAKSDSNTLPTLGLALYDGYRALLLDLGWKPIQMGFDSDHGFPEVSCGYRRCSADWSRPDSVNVSIVLWSYYTDDERRLLFLAPQVFPDAGRLYAEEEYCATRNFIIMGSIREARNPTW